MNPAKYRAVIAAISPGPADSLVEAFQELGISVRQLGLSRIGSLLFGVRELRRLVSEVRPDLVHCHGIRADVLAAMAGLACPVVTTLHSDLLRDYRSGYGRLVGTVAANCEYAALRCFSGVIAVSQPLAEVASLRGVAAHAIPNGVEIDEFCPAAGLDSVTTLRARFGWPAGALVVLHTGVLRSLKNPGAVLRGFRASTISRQGLLVFAGDGPLLAQCKKLASGASNIVFLAKRNDISELLRAADILISASSSEGLGTALLEGCASGIRILASDIPAHRYIQGLFPGQVTIFGRGDAESVRAILDSVGQKDARLRFLPPQSALEGISARRMSESYQRFYSEILQSASSSRLCRAE
jgi:glycosyltransferase involved in cell wall biosynthesis